MNKRKIKQVSVKFESGDIDTFDCDGTFSESFNSRKKAGFANDSEWVEYHITWLVYVRDLLPIVETIPEPEHHREEAWCGQHKMPPGECFKLHNPTAYSGRHQQWDDVEAIGRKELPAVFKKVSSFPEFDISDLLEGYGNGSARG